MPIEIINQFFELREEAKAYFRAYEVTGDELLLLTSQQLEQDALLLELIYI